ncbi:MAG: MFS transporter [Candidatus Rokuibacteriota bacterium]|nr:MAG: MFS transporter [Candidatus Rokubacteria bacterium]
MRLPRPLRALRHRDFRLFWCGQLVSLSGTWMQSLGQSWLVLELTNSPFRLGLLTALQFGPFLVLSFFTGVLADRLPKRRLLTCTQATLLLQAATLSILVSSGHVRYWHVAVLAACAGIVNTLDMPARQSFIVEMVGKEDLLNAIALNSAAFNAARVVGPAAAGFLIGRYGVATAFALNAGSFVAVIAALWWIRSEGLSQGPVRASLLDQVAEGLRYAVQTPRIVMVLALLFTTSLCIFNYNVVVPLLAKDVLHQDAHGFGVLMAMLGTGALVGAVALTVLATSRPPFTFILAAATVVSVATLGLGLARQFWMAGTLLFVMGLSGIVFMTSCNTTLQLGVPDRLRGRMMSLYTLVFVGTTPIGSFLIGSIAGGAGPKGAFIAGGGLSLAFVVVIALWRRARRRRIAVEPPPTPAA